MGSITRMCLFVIGTLCFLQVQSFQINKEFANGNLEFTWTNVSTRLNDIVITKNGINSSWIRIADDKYTVKDVWRYKSVNIKVREYTKAGHEDYTSTHIVSTIDSQEGETKNLTWTAKFFPRSGQYNIYHFYGDKNKTVIRVQGDNVTSIDPVKYVYRTRPYNSTNIVVEVKNIALMDAGYYGGGTSPIAARSEPGLVLVVKGKPTKPEIRGTMNPTETSDFTLTCTSQSSSRPSYYSKSVSLSYIWYRNTVMHSESGRTLRFLRISKDVRFNKYSCQSKESIVSEKSEEIQINVLYGPSSVTISPQLPVNKTVSVKEGDYIGPYTCSADCNPPCSIQWRYKLSNGTFEDAQSNGSTLLRQRVFREKASFCCVAKLNTGVKWYENIKLRIMYLSKPEVMINSKREENVNIIEGEYLNIVCSVEAKPTPTLSINRDSQENILKTRQSNSIEALNQRVQCDDTDTYKCTASSAGFADKHTEVTLNVLCRTRMDVEAGFKTSYGSRSGSGVTVIVNAPIISNPKPTANLISWSGPTSGDIQNEITERDVMYKHLITSTIPVNNDRYFGIYTLTYNREVIFTITIQDCESGYYLNDKNSELNFRSDVNCLPCGNCRDDVPCNTTTGQCSDGCKANYKPPYCTELIKSDKASTIQTTTIVIAILATISVVAIATIIGMVFRQKLKRRLECKQSEPENERERTMDATRQQLRSDGGPEFPLHDYEKINTTMDGHTYDQVGRSNEGDYEDVQAGSSSDP